VLLLKEKMENTMGKETRGFQEFQDSRCNTLGKGPHLPFSFSLSFLPIDLIIRKDMMLICKDNFVYKSFNLLIHSHPYFAESRVFR
jgi:hypothetical protein